MIRFGAAACHDLPKALRKEWLETNGLGGYASSTIVGANTRRYHGLLVAATRPPVGRMVLLSKLEEELARRDALAELGCNLYPGTVHPQGHRHLAEFKLDPFPTFTYVADDVCLIKRVFMVHGYNATVIQYELAEADEPVRLALTPLIAAREHHHLQRWNEALQPQAEVAEGQVALCPYGDATRLRLAFDRGEFVPAQDWYYSFVYAREQDRGLDHKEDLFCPGRITMTLRQGETASIIASHGEPPALDAAEAAKQERQRRLALSPDDATPASRTLRAAADAFVVRRRGDQRSIIAGYHWFADWGRDAMIALPGLLLTTRRFDLAREVLSSFAAHCSQGMIPNMFPEGGEEPAYNTVDASLWFAHAVRAYADASRDFEFVLEQMWDTLCDIVAHYRRGTRHGIRMDEDGLITAGDAATQLTWMDAKVGDWVVTPRHGKCVEINALWYNALRHVEHFCARFDEDALGSELAALAERTKRSFEAAFWNEELGCLYDCVREDEADASIRPNQILAVSLPYSLLPHDKEEQVVDTVRHELLTLMGLRSLSPRDPAYVGRYGGDQRERDGAYHQGTVWAWLIGPFLTAWLKVNEYSEAAIAFARKTLEPLIAHLDDAGLGSISEIFDGDEPHLPRGAIAQAWSVAEVLRILVEVEGRDS